MIDCKVFWMILMNSRKQDENITSKDHSISLKNGIILDQNSSTVKTDVNVKTVIPKILDQNKTYDVNVSELNLYVTNKDGMQDINRSVKIVEKHKNTTTDFNLVMMVGIGFLLLFVLFLLLKNRTISIPIVSQELQEKHNNDLLKNSIDEQNWDMLEEISKDASFSNNIKQKARDALKSKLN